MSTVRLLAVTAAFGFVSACATSEAPAPVYAEADKIDAFVSEAMAELAVVPGMAVAVYAPEGVYMHGFGVTDLETNTPVTPDTAFYIASSTKSLTAMTMAILDSEGRIDLDQTIAEFAPDAPFPDDIRADEVTIRHLLSHTSGLDNSPIGFRAAYTGQHTPELNWKLLAKTRVKEDAPLGTFDYTNEGYNILTILTDRQLGVNWQELVDETLLQPLGMEETTAYMSEANAPGRTLARPYFGGLEGGAVRVPLEKIDATMQSAGGHVMSASDALRWLEFLVEDGMLGGEQIVPAEVVRSTRAPLAEVDEDFDAYSRDSYGLGWYNSTYKGELLVHHFGGYTGYRAHISYMPEHDIGVAVFSNEVPVAYSLPEAVANYVYDMALGSEAAAADAEEAIAALKDRRARIIENVANDRARRAKREWQLTLPKSAYTGTYVNEDFGTVDVTLEEGELVLTMGNLVAVAEPFTREDSIRVEMVPFQGEVILFQMDDAGAPSGFNYDGDIFARVN